ncbi:unnamed protein product, partial [Vitis vinifera]
MFSSQGLSYHEKTLGDFGSIFFCLLFSSDRWPHPSLHGIITHGRIPFAFLEDIHQRFVKTYGRAIHPAPAYAMNDEFSRVLSQQMDHYSNDPNADRLNRSKDEMSKV